MTLTVESMRGMWRAQVDHRSEFAPTLEELLLQLAPDAPEEYVWHAAEVLGSILGAETVELSNGAVGDELLEADRATEMLSALFGQPVDQSWRPTEAQQAYFDGERTEDAEAFEVPDEYPRGV